MVYTGRQPPPPGGDKQLEGGAGTGHEETCGEVGTEARREWACREDPQWLTRQRPSAGRRNRGAARERDPEHTGPALEGSTDP